ncbi:hypothetical protein HF638_12505 [Paenibacillus sp. SZ31]|uniref:hypothetical protein n=1 Tax=unclassified Paenibacillus TaxID=185978 RepID=UPI00146D8F1B|nr:MULTISPECIES: hypothetical protein [unclassified Paenibacillus]MCG7377389.1 hypothetical protein [Paenibacillus sp. ACRSA]NMI04804.1 hypothetical protein [Paenibacillus sp. SZ31]
MATVLTYTKKDVRPTLDNGEFFDLLFDKAKREAIYRKFDEDYVEIEEDNFVEMFRKKKQIDE